MKIEAKGITGYLGLGAAQGLAAWSAYAVLEFLASSVLSRLGRPYARFTAWHWQLTGELAAAYLAAGLAAGLAVGLANWLLPDAWWKRDRRFLALGMEHAATLTLACALAIHMTLQPAAPDVWWKLLLVPLAIIAMLLLALRSQRWSQRLGLLTNPWMVTGVFLGMGQISALQFMGVAKQLGTGLQAWRWLLLAVLAAAMAGAVWLGRKWRRAAGTERVLAINWAATGLAAALAVCGFVLGAEPAFPQQPPAARLGTAPMPNVVVIVMDTVRADHLSLFGYQRDTTPRLDQLARGAMVYPRAVSPADNSLSSHASIFTGLYASWHGAYCQPPEAAYGRTLGPVPTLAEVLSAHGYRTLGAGANLFLRSDFGLQRGFRQFRIPRPVAVLAPETWYLLRNGMRGLLSLVTDTSQFDRLYARGDAVTNEFFDMAARADADPAPFFAFLNYMDAHFPYIPPSPFDRRFPGKVSATQADLVKIHRSVGDRGEPLPPSYVIHSAAEYDGAIAYMDAQIGRVVDWLKSRQLYDNTLLVVTSDHGEAFGERRLFQHSNSLYANLLHVGLLVKYPHSAHVGVVEAPVSLIDIFPTVLRAVGVEAPPGIQGKDLLDPAAIAPRTLFSESFPCPVMHQPECPGGCLMRSVMSWPNKYIDSSSGKVEVYDLEKDPGELRNMFGSLNPMAQALASELNSWIHTMPAPAKAPHGPAEAAAAGME